MEYNLDGLMYITGYDLSNKDKMCDQNIKSVSLITEPSFKSRLVITKIDNTEETFDIDYTEYYLHLRKLKINKIMKKINLFI
jgi:hypothetical protein